MYEDGKLRNSERSWSVSREAYSESTGEELAETQVLGEIVSYINIEMDFTWFIDVIYCHLWTVSFQMSLIILPNVVPRKVEVSSSFLNLR